MRLSDGGLSLRLAKLMYEDTGIYTVLVENGAGTDSATFSLYIPGMSCCVCVCLAGCVLVCLFVCLASA